MQHPHPLYAELAGNGSAEVFGFSFLMYGNTGRFVYGGKIGVAEEDVQHGSGGLTYRMWQ
ncbi:hypothetical protein l11_15480 [Neisseria weaveri LMG 5135]|nr:hypothetical protein l11_15480 [Neisseria weaveri LMG 5135]